jgi:hypothetical protein
MRARRLFRVLLVFVTAILMVVAGIWWLAYALFWSPVISITSISGGIGLAGVGSYILWNDYILPAHRIETRQPGPSLAEMEDL